LWITHQGAYADQAFRASHASFDQTDCLEAVVQLADVLNGDGVTGAQQPGQDDPADPPNPAVMVGPLDEQSEQEPGGDTQRDRNRRQYLVDRIPGRCQ
jgi:hypothetical protein